MSSYPMQDPLQTQQQLPQAVGNAPQQAAQGSNARVQDPSQLLGRLQQVTARKYPAVTSWPGRSRRRSTWCISGPASQRRMLMWRASMEDSATNA